MISFRNLEALPGRGVVYWDGSLCHRPEKMQIREVFRYQRFTRDGVAYDGLRLFFKKNHLTDVEIKPEFLYGNWTEWYRKVVELPWEKLVSPMQYVPLVDWPDNSQRVAKVVEDTGIEDLDKLMEVLQNLREDFKREGNWPQTLSPGMAADSCLPCIVSLARRRPDIRRRDGHDMSRLWAILVDGEKE